MKQFKMRIGTLNVTTNKGLFDSSKLRAVCLVDSKERQLIDRIITDKEVKLNQINVDQHLDDEFVEKTTGERRLHYSVYRGTHPELKISKKSSFQKIKAA